MYRFYCDASFFFVFFVDRVNRYLDRQLLKYACEVYDIHVPDVTIYDGWMSCRKQQHNWMKERKKVSNILLIVKFNT